MPSDHEPSTTGCPTCGCPESHGTLSTSHFYAVHQLRPRPSDYEIFTHRVLERRFVVGDPADLARLILERDRDRTVTPVDSESAPLSDAIIALSKTNAKPPSHEPRNRHEKRVANRAKGRTR